MEVELAFLEAAPANSLVLLRDKKQGFLTPDVLGTAVQKGEERKLWLNYGKDFAEMPEPLCEVAVLDLRVRSQEAQLEFKSFKP